MLAIMFRVMVDPVFEEGVFGLGVGLGLRRRGTELKEKSDASVREAAKAKPCLSQEKAPDCQQRYLARRHGMPDIWNVVKRTARSRFEPFRFTVLKAAWRQHQIDLLRRMPMIGIAHVGRKQ